LFVNLQTSTVLLLSLRQCLPHWWKSYGAICSSKPTRKSITTIWTSLPS